jgi:hypothetical protein
VYHTEVVTHPHTCSLLFYYSTDLFYPLFLILFQFISSFRYFHFLFLPSFIGPGQLRRTRYWLDVQEIRIPVGGEIFCPRPDRPWSSPSLVYNGYWLSVQGIKWPGRGFNHPPSSSGKVKEKVELYLYYPSGPSWPVLG